MVVRREAVVRVQRVGPPGHHDHVLGARARAVDVFHRQIEAGPVGALRVQLPGVHALLLELLREPLLLSQLASRVKKMILLHQIQGTSQNLARL